MLCKQRGKTAHLIINLGHFRVSDLNLVSLLKYLGNSSNLYESSLSPDTFDVFCVLDFFFLLHAL